MRERPVLIDLCSCAGGIARGYARAGFDVVCVDTKPQPNNPYPLCVDDALDVMFRLLDGQLVDFARRDGSTLRIGAGDIDAAHASVPCQAYSTTAKLAGNEGDPRLIEPMRELLEEFGAPWAMENVPRAPLRRDLILCGSHFGLAAVDRFGLDVELRRHRVFESNVDLGAPPMPCRHGWHGRTASIFGSGGGWGFARASGENRRGGYKPDRDTSARLLGLDGEGLTMHELSESVPPVYGEYVGARLMAAL